MSENETLVYLNQFLRKCCDQHSFLSDEKNYNELRHIGMYKIDTTTPEHVALFFETYKEVLNFRQSDECLSKGCHCLFDIIEKKPELSVPALKVLQMVLQSKNKNIPQKTSKEVLIRLRSLTDCRSEFWRTGEMPTYPQELVEQIFATLSTVSFSEDLKQILGNLSMITKGTLNIQVAETPQTSSVTSRKITMKVLPKLPPEPKQNDGS